MDYHYDPVQAVFDGWIVVLMVTLTVVAGVRLRGTRRLLVAGGFGVCAVATVLWLPMVAGLVLGQLVTVMDPDLVWQVPTLPWLIGIVLVAIGIFQAPWGSGGHTQTGPGAGPAYPPPNAPVPPSAPVPPNGPVPPDRLDYPPPTDAPPAGPGEPPGFEPPSPGLEDGRP